MAKIDDICLVHPVKYINSISFGNSQINKSGEIRTITIAGDVGAKFKLQLNFNNTNHSVAQTGKTAVPPP